jgi:hypothetical protein
MASATNAVYISQAGAGAANGTNCANAKPYSYFNTAGNWNASPTGVQIGPGTTIHACNETDTFTSNTSALTFQCGTATGSAGNLLTLSFDQGGTTLQAPYFSATGGAITNSGTCAYTVIDGANNLTIKNTANGTLLANLQNSYGVFFSGCTNCTIKNLTAQSIYVNNGSGSGATDTNGQNTACIEISGAATGSIISGNTLSQCKTGVLVSADPNLDASNVQVVSNTISDMDWGINVGGGNAGDTITGLVIHDNSITNWTNWQFPSSAFHQDGIILFNFAGGSATLAATLYNNYIYGDLGTSSPTAFIYCAQNTTCTLYNNLLVNTGHLITGMLWLDTHLGCYKVYQNTVVGNASNSDIAITFGTSTATSGACANVIQNNIFSGVGVGLHDYSTLISDVSASDHNVWRTGSGGSPQMSTNDSTFLSYATWLADGFDANSSTATPNLSGTYIPQPTSSAIGRGANLNSILSGVLNTDYAGNSRGAGCSPSINVVGCWDAGALMYTLPVSGTTIFSGNAILSGSLKIQSSGGSGNPVQLTTSSPLPNATVGTLYSDTLTATGGLGGYTWTLFSGAYPTGSNFSLGSASGILSGVPSATSTCSSCFTIQVCDSSLTNCASKAFSITVANGPLAFVNNTLASGTQGAAYSSTALMTGGTLPYTACSVFSGSLPTGLSAAIATNGCLISGTLGGGATTSSFVLSGTDSASTTVQSATLTINVNVAGACGTPFFPCGNISTTIHPLAQSSNTNPSCFDSPGAANCKQPVPQIGFANVLGQFTITTPGTCATHPTISFSGGTFTRAGAATGVWSASNSLTGIVYSDYGAYTVAPSVVFSGGSCATTPVATVALQSLSCNGHQCQGGLFGANSVVNGYSGAIVGNDPFYGSQRVMRLTDALIDPTNPYRSCFTDSSAENAQTNYDGTIIKASCGAWSDLFSLDYSIWNSAACVVGSTTCNAAKLQLVGKGGNFPSSFIFGQTNTAPGSPADPTSDTYAFYAFDNCGVAGLSTCARIERWLICGPAGNTSTLCPGGWKAVIDPNWPTTGSNGYDITQSSCAGSTYMTGSTIGQGIFTPWASFGNASMDAADTRFAVELRIFNGLQDEGGTSVTLDTSTAGSPRCKVLDISRGTVSTDWNNSTPIAITSATCSGSSCTQLFNPLLPPAAPVLASGGTGSLNAAHIYAVALSYSLRNSRGTQKSPGDQGETDGSAVSTITGVTSIAITAPGVPADASPGVAPVAGQNIPNSNCSLGTKKTRCVTPTGYNPYICDRTTTPGCTPVRAQVDQAPAAVTSLTCTPASGNSGSTYTYIYHVTVRHLTGTTLDYGSQDVAATCTTASPISSTLPNALSWTAPTISTSLLYDIDRGATSTTVMENLVGRIACAASPCNFSDTSIGNISGEEEIVSGATTSGITISSLPASGSSVMYAGLQGLGGASTHNIKIDMSGNPVIPVPTAIANTLGYPGADWYWYPDSTASCNSQLQVCPYNIARVFYCPLLCTGHRVAGPGGQVRNPGNTSNLQFLLMAPAEGQNVVSLVNDSNCAGQKCQAAQHDNWSLGTNSFANYVMPTTYTAQTAYGKTSWPTQLYTGEAFFLPMGDSRVSSSITSISQTGTTVTAVLAASVGCPNNVLTLCFAKGIPILTSAIPLGVSASTNWNGQHTLASVNFSTNQVTWTSGISVSDSAGIGGSLNGCSGGAVLTGGALSNPNCYPIREGMIYSNGNEATRFYGTPRGFTSQAGTAKPLIYTSSAYTYWNEAATHFNQVPTTLARVSGTVTATFASTANLSPNATAISVIGTTKGHLTPLPATCTASPCTDFAGRYPIVSVTGTTVTWLQPGVADDALTPTAGTCNGAGTATCVDASDSYCLGSSLGDEFGAPDINMNVTTQAGCRVDILMVEPL